MIESQRQTSTLHVLENDYLSALNESAQKKKAIRKERDAGKNHQPKLTKEERMKLQKEKNREAAQRSRDQHREYVTNLEMEVTLLQQQVESNKHLCSRCHQQLTQADMFIDADLKSELLFEDDLFGKEEEPQQAEGEVKVEDQAEYYLRMGSEEEDFSYLKMMLFIAMIAVAVFIFPTTSETDHSRQLMNFYTPATPKPSQDEFAMFTEEGSINAPQQPDLIADFNNSLVVRNSVVNQQCLDSLIQERSFSLTNLRTAYSSLGKSQMNEGILLCSFQQPKQGNVDLAGDQKSALVRLFVLGAEVKEMITANSPITQFIGSNIQLNGIYRIAAEVKQVELISHHNCLL